jgi:hypothetical protein
VTLSCIARLVTVKVTLANQPAFVAVRVLGLLGVTQLPTGRPLTVLAVTGREEAQRQGGR